MKLIFFTLLFFLLINEIQFAQWYQQTSGTNDILRGVSFSDPNYGTAVGNNGKILRTTSGGQNWYSQSSGTTNTLFGVCFTDDLNGWVVGIDGTILRTTDGGENWSIQISGTTSILHGVCFINNMNGWAVGSEGTILQTRTGGEIWDIKTSGTPRSFYSISFPDLNNGWVVGVDYGGYGLIIRTTDGGQNWVNQPIGIIGMSVILGVFFTDSINGTAVGYEQNPPYTCFVLRTTNGGQNWVNQFETSFTNLYGVCFTDTSNGTIVGSYSGSGLIKRTTDGGQSWLSQSIFVYPNLLAIFFTDENNGTAVGYEGTILHTTNGGISFVEEETISELPTEFYLSQNYPNPFNPSSKIQYSIPQSSYVVIKVFDILGNEIETLINEYKPVGIYEITWYAEKLPSGIYFYQLKANNFIQTRKMVLIK